MTPASPRALGLGDQVRVIADVYPETPKGGVYPITQLVKRNLAKGVPASSYLRVNGQLFLSHELELVKANA
jgi:hypothetical protein